jgi:hypothetical protein
MDLNPMWLVPLAVGALGAVGAVLWARAVAGEVERLQSALRPLRATRVRKPSRPR